MERFTEQNFSDNTVMYHIFRSKITAWAAILLTVALIVICFILNFPWWGFIGLFFLFLACFTHLVSLYLGKINAMVGNKLERCSFVCIILAIVAFIVEYIFFNLE